MYIPRALQPHLLRMLLQFPVVSITGPRQSGKTTLLANALPGYKYFNLERLDYRQLVMQDPMGFLRGQGPRVIFDEAQNLPDLFGYIQVASDELATPGQYVLSGSQSFLMSQHISQSLAGRVYIGQLLPFSLTELATTSCIYSAIHRGFYPRLHALGIEPSDFYPSYLQSYIERDIRSLSAVGDLNTFTRFLSLCAGRVGQILNLTSLANDVGVAVNTVKSWLSLLESSYVIFLLQPYHQNFSKRIIKSPKLYFYDTGVVCSLLRIESPEHLKTHYLFGALLENLVIGEIVKQHYHQGKRPSVYYWRESNGTEIDCIVELNSGNPIAIEVKGGQTIHSDYFKNLKRYPGGCSNKMVVYAGNQSIETGDISIIPWDAMPSAIQRVV